jgi:HAE1 family hydrophobic/amphiphilic exporter-1
MMAGIGLVILVGIVVNNAIVLVDRVQQYMGEGRGREEALLLAGRDRLRPILMTAATTIVGLLPMALGKSGIVGTPYYPLGRAVIGGLLASTVLSLLLVPLFYTYLDDLRHLLGMAVRAPAADGGEPAALDEV